MNLLFFLLSGILGDIKAPEIKIIDERSKIYTGTDTVIIKLEDIIKYTGKICPGICAGIRTTMVGLKAIYEQEIPKRGEIQVAVPFRGEFANVISYITGTRFEHSTILVDTTLVQDTVVSYIFGRKGGKTVKVTLNEVKIHSHHKNFTLETFTQFLKDMLNGKRDEIYTIEDIEYVFPEEKAHMHKHIHEDEDEE